MMKMQLNIILKYLIINELTIKKRIYLNAKERYNIIQKNNRDDKDDQDDYVKSNYLACLSHFFRSRLSFSIKL